ncbi:tyrosine-type recombinase/integrase [Mycobacterium pseudokansasii]|uniref:tyrosine-type recombinase/integrase n=1 Tax=Mycobacterium pseudokansasii TaxID=2341080 RepID=UPI0007B501F3|nr:site-specific integrase [Mycobacterium pseudokansasii]KZS61218.1 integrase [Mycobacterium kansasii]VAZ93329.1 Putative prophage phiRv2 integrase [Mycobacterium pseudokansasii]VAZ94346.1 Putative prophage phiRv2 integrase [Mycobacterium pseudokansasii]
MARDRRSFGRLRKLPSGRYQAAYVGPDDKLHVAESTFAAKVDAEAWLTDRRREIDRELWSPPVNAEQHKAARRQRKAATVRFKEYAERWVKTRTVRGRPLKPRTVEHYESMLADHIYPTFGSRPVRDITMQAVDRWYARTLTDKPTLRAHCYSLLRTILETARTRDRLIDINPAMIRGAGTTQRKIKPKPATLDELAVLESEMPERLQLMVTLAAWCALRFGELVELRRGDIDIDEAVVRIRRAAVRVDGGWKLGDPKSDAGQRDVAIPPHIVPAAVKHLADHVKPESDALLFPAKAGGYLQPSSLYRHFYKARATAKRPDLRWHDLRHSGAVLAAQTGATLAELMARLGHSTPQAAMRYQHAAQGRDQAIAAALSVLAAGKGQS